MSEATQSPNRLHFAAWRWHFYAGLYVIPFLLMLAVTGLIMLWVSSMTELNGERAHVSPGTALLPVSKLQAAADLPCRAARQHSTSPRWARTGWRPFPSQLARTSWASR
jgi:uncharacterized iron-regulated membrane protein